MPVNCNPVDTPNGLCLYMAMPIDTQYSQDHPITTASCTHQKIRGQNWPQSLGVKLIVIVFPFESHIDNCPAKSHYVPPISTHGISGAVFDPLFIALHFFCCSMCQGMFNCRKNIAFLCQMLHFCIWMQNMFFAEIVITMTLTLLVIGHMYCVYWVSYNRTVDSSFLFDKWSRGFYNPCLILHMWSLI